MGDPADVGWQERQPRRGPGWQIIRYTSARSAASRLHLVRYDLEDCEVVEQFNWHIRPDHQTFYARAKVPARLVEQYGRGIITMHRLIMGGSTGRIGHLNGDGLDNRRANLARMSMAEIVAKRRPPKKPGTSKYKGVVWDKGQRRWMATFRRKKLGRFHDEEEAARAVDDAAFAHWGHKAYLNFPDRHPRETDAEPSPPSPAESNEDETATSATARRSARPRPAGPPTL